MPYGAVQLIPGVNVERTPTLLKTGYAQSSLIRFRDGLGQKLGGWTKFYGQSVAGVPRELHAWEDLNDVTHLLVGTTTQLAAITNGQLADITPQTLKSDFAPNFSTTAGSNVVQVTDPNIANVSIYDAILFNVPVSIGGLILSGIYAIEQINGADSYQFIAASNATSTNTNPTATNNSTASGNNTLHFGTTPPWVVANMVVFDLTTPSAIPAGTLVQSTTGTTVVMSNNASGAGVGSGDNIVFCSVPVFTTTSGSAVVNVFLVNHGLSVGDDIVFPISTTGNNVTIFNDYKATAIVDSNNFQIAVNTQANASSSFVMNNGDAELIYYLNIGPPAAGSGFGLGGFGSGGFGTGSSTSQQTGTEITATDWTSDSWGEVILACPSGGGVYQFDPTSGFTNAGLVATAPPFNASIFVSQTLQILVCLGSTAVKDIGIQQDPLLVAWSTLGDYTVFGAKATNLAGNFRIPLGTKIIGGMAAGQQNLIWTDLDLWAMTFIGAGTQSGSNPVFGFNKMGAGAGLISARAALQLRGAVYWMGPSNFYQLNAGGVSVLPCPVWDFVFQNLDPNNAFKARSMPNTPFNEAGFLFTSKNSPNGENDCYVKFNITEQGAPWDFGPSNALPRSAWMDQSVLGNPLGASPGGIIYQHETSTDADGQPLAYSFTTGYFFIAEGEDFAFVDQILPDFIWGYFGQAQTAQVQLTVFALNYPGDTPAVFGPFLVTQATKYISVRGIRHRQMAFQVSGADLGSFVRLGRIRYRWAPCGRQ